MRKVCALLLAACLALTGCDKTTGGNASASGGGTAAPAEGAEGEGTAAGALPAGELHRLASGNESGGIQMDGMFYEVYFSSYDAPGLLLATDLSAATQTIACRAEGCAHTGDACPALLPAGGYLFGSGEELFYYESGYFQATQQEHASLYEIVPGVSKNLLLQLEGGYEAMSDFYSDGTNLFVALFQPGSNTALPYLAACHLAAKTVAPVANAPVLDGERKANVPQYSLLGVHGAEFVFEKATSPLDPPDMDLPAFASEEEEDAYFNSPEFEAWNKQLEEYGNSVVRAVTAWSPAQNVWRDIAPGHSSSGFPANLHTGGSLYYFSGEGMGQGSLNRLDLATGGSEVLSASLPGQFWYGYRLLDGLLFAIYSGDFEAGDFDSYYAVLDSRTGAQLTDIVPSPMAGAQAGEPCPIVAAYGGQYLAVTSMESDGPESGYRHIYSLISSEDYRTGNAKFTPVQMWQAS